MLSHHISINVFCKPESDLEIITKKLLFLIPFDTKKEKIELKKTNATGFNEKKIIILEIYLEKEKHINKFLENLNKKLSKEQKELLIKQAESRLDDELNFFLRFDKEALVNENKLLLTDKGDCYHITIKIAAFPHKRESALKVIDKIFSN
jgi:RNA binding exosome subunit